jgi:hypothetical protein
VISARVENEPSRAYVSLLLVLSVFAITTAGQQLPPPRVVDLKAPDGTILKATYSRRLYGRRLVASLMAEGPVGLPSSNTI